jgi:hypothetical protein
LTPYADEQFLLLDPAPRTIDALARAFDAATLPHVDVVASEAVLRTVRRNFVLAIRVATAVAAERCRLQATDTEDLSTLFVSPQRVCVVVVVMDDTVTVRELPSADWTTAFHTEARETFVDAEPYPLRTPTRDELLSANDSNLPAAFHEDFETALAVTASFDDPEAFDPVRTALVLAARHAALNYDVSRWGERLGVASSATFSRRKGQLEDADHLTTEEVSTGLGRSRQRLLLTDASWAALDDGGLAELLRRVHE